MYIKSIILDGFKSYGQRTEVGPFDPQFNAITGLNGTGKSNILDSICFVLGISNLTHVRANSLQDLIFKSGQAGINKATVSIKFDNTNPLQCPPGFENLDEITITRQIALGGKNKYLINGVNVVNKKIQDLFCSVQLNVNNPHFLIMQGKITKVLNMKPAEILSMMEEAAGTRMYESKRQHTNKLLDKKKATLAEFQNIMTQELGPRIEKLRAERDAYLEFQRTERELEHLLGIYQVWQYFEAKKKLAKAEEALEKGEAKIKSIEDKIEQNKRNVEQLDEEIEDITKNNASDKSQELQELEARLKAKEKEEAKANSLIKTVQDNVASEEKKQKQLERSVASDKRQLSTKENELNKVQGLFETLKENDRKDTEALNLAEKKYEALCAGMEVNDAGETETLAEQLMRAKEEASTASTESKQATMQLSFCQNQLKQKQKESGSSTSDYETEKANLQKTEREVAQLEASMQKLHFSEERMGEMRARSRALQHEVRELRDRLENFSATRPYASFKYRDPEPNFNRGGVKGVVCKLFNCADERFCTALETAAGGKLYNVVVDNDATSKKLLQRGDLQTRTTFIPLNKISSYKIDQNTVRLAQDLVGKENCQFPLSLINYDKSLQAAMEYVFGNVLICKDISVARKVAFHDRIRKKCVTLDGDSVDPSGILSGGAKQKGESILKQIKNVLNYEKSLKIKEDELAGLEQAIRQMSGAEEQYNSIKYKLDISKNNVNLIRQKLMNTTFARQQEEVDTLKSQIAELQEKVKNCQEVEKKCLARSKDLEAKMKDSKGYRDKRLKEAETEMKMAKAQADKSKKEWRQREQDYETLLLEIAELKKSIAATEQELAQTQEAIEKLQGEFRNLTEGSKEVKDAVAELEAEVKSLKAQIHEKNKEIHNKTKKKDQLLAQNNELELEIKKNTHEIKDLTNACKSSKFREQEYAKKMGKNNKFLEQGQSLSQREGEDLERRIKTFQEKKNRLARTVNPKAQSMFDNDQKALNDLTKRQESLQADKGRLENCIKELDEKKEKALKLAYDQVSRDFGSIFATLLPGSNAKLATLPGKNILQGLEIKVALGNVWKESLTELSGGQRSLAALSLILAMLLFKPAPLYILDEVDAALDLSHTQNIGQMLRTHFKRSQFIVVSLKDGMFSNANVLFRTKFIDGVSAVQRSEAKRK